MGLYEDLYEEYIKQDELDVKSPGDVKSLIFSELMRVRIVKNLLEEIFPLKEAITSDELHDIMEIVEKWEKQLADKVEHH